MVRTQIQLTDGQAAQVRQLAAAEHVSMAEIVRRGIDLYMRHASVPRAETLRERARAAAGRFHSGNGDTSANHDQVLAEAFQS